MSEAYLNMRLEGWQKRLKLEQWSVSIRMSRPSDLRTGTKGAIRWDANKRQAVIRVLAAESYPMPYQSMLNDMEFTVVHELVHLQLSSLPRSEASRTDEEHAVNRITEALLDLDRVHSKPAH